MADSLMDDGYIKELESVIQNLLDSLHKGDKESIKKNLKYFKDSKSKINKELSEENLKTILKDSDRVRAYKKGQELQDEQETNRRQLQLIKEAFDYQRKGRLQIEQEVADAQKKYAETLNKDSKAAQKKALKDLKNAERKQERQEAKDKGEQVQFGDQFKEAFHEALVNQDKQGGAKAVWEKDLMNTVKGIGNSIKQGLNQINSAIDSYAKYQTGINARLQGLSSFNSIAKNLETVAFSPLINAQNLYENMNTLVNEGVASNIEQRAFFMTVKDGIATTFDANSTSLRRLIRIQQDDSTAARLGMESYLTRFLNEFVESTEYLTTTFDSVADSLLEASALLSSRDATEFEYIVQKWLGTLTGVGLSESAAQSIANALGYLGSGNIDNLSSDNMQNLIVMAASKMGLSYADMLTGGLNSNDTNTLLYGITSYLQEIGGYSSNIVKSQLAKTFGVSISDLVAANSLNKTELKSLYDNMLSYGDMYSELSGQFNQLSSREGISNILNNLFSNYTYQTGMNIASNPALFATWKITDLIQGVTNGINIPYISALGNGIDLETTVENLIKIGIVGISTIDEIGGILNGLKSVKNGSSLLTALGVEMNGTRISRGKGLSGYNSNEIGSGGVETTSAAEYIGNESGQDYADSIVNENMTSANTQLDQKLDESVQSDAVVSYLTDLNFASTLDTIRNDIHEMSSNGIKVTNMIEADIISEGIQGWYTELQKDIAEEGV